MFVENEALIDYCIFCGERVCRKKLSKQVLLGLPLLQRSEANIILHVYLQRVSYKRYFRCNNCFLLSVYSIHLSLSTNLVDPPSMGTIYMKHPLGTMNQLLREKNPFLLFTLIERIDFKTPFFSRHNIVVRHLMGPYWLILDF